MSASAISWIVTILFIVILAAGFFIGMWRGLRKSLFFTIVSLIGAVAAFFLTPVVTNAIMGIKVNSDGMLIPLSEVIVNMLKKNADVNALIENNPNMQTFFERLPYAIGNTVVFILLTLAIELVLYIIYRIVASTCMKNKEGQSMHRLSGGFIGLGATFVLFIFAFMPLTSLLSTADTVTTTNEYTVEADTGDNKAILEGILPEQAVVAIKGANKSLLAKVSGLFGMDNVLFDYYANVTIDNQKVYIRQEVVNYYSAVDFANQLRSNNVNFKKIDYAKLNQIIERIENGGLFKSIVPSAIKDVVLNYNNYSFLRNSALVTEYEDVITKIGDDIRDLSGEALFNYVKNDLDRLFDAFKSLGQKGIIDGIKDLNEKTAKNITNLLTNEENYNNFKSALRKVFDVNVVKASLGKITEKVIGKAGIDELDQISVDTSEWAKEKWDNLSTNFAETCKLLATLLNQVELDIIKDLTQLLDTTKYYNATAILNNIGALVDKVRANDLLKTAENKSIFDSFLSDNDLTLPEGQVKDLNDNSIAIQNYTQLMNFIAPAIEKVKANNMYATIQKPANEAVEDMATVISAEGNENLLSEILLPLYQVNVTKKMIFDGKLSTLENDIVDFSVLTNYDEWKKDLGYISQILRGLTSEDAKIGDNTYLYTILNVDNGFNDVLDNMTDAQIDEILKPIFYAKSTDGIRVEVANTIKTALDEITSPAGSTININSVTLVEGAEEDQAQEICNIVKQFIKVDGDTINNIDKEVLGALLAAMQVNAYRFEREGKTETGLFNGAFINLVNKVKSNYSIEIAALIASDPDDKYTVEYFDEANYPNIDFVDLMDKLA